MPKCTRCGKKGLFFKVNTSGHCADCAAVMEHQKNKEALIPQKTIFDLKMDGSLPKYTYKKVKLDSSVIYPPTIMRIGQVCGFFRMEQDSDVIEVHIHHGNDDLLIGFLPPGRLAEMAGDWFDRSWISAGQISSFENKEIYIDMAFWRSLEE